MRFLQWLLSLPLFAATIVFIIQNRMMVTISFWPFDLEAELPVSVLSLGLLILGMLIGIFLTSFTVMRAKMEVRRLRKELKQLSKEPPISYEEPMLYKGSSHAILPPAQPNKKKRFKFWSK